LNAALRYQTHNSATNGLCREMLQRGRLSPIFTAMMVSETNYEAVVAGLGPAGLAAAMGLALAGLKVVAIGRASWFDKAREARTVALMLPSLRFLGHLGVWPERLAGVSAPLKRLRIVDETASLFGGGETVFEASELGEEVFGWNIPLHALVPALRQRAEELGVVLIADDIAGAEIGSDSVRILRTGGPSLAAPVAIAADGRQSRLRAAAGIAVKEKTYPQAALATSFDHSGPHRSMSSEYHRPGGPLTTVPLPGNRSGLVWMDAPGRIAALAAMDEAAFCHELQAATHGDLGRIGACGVRQTFAMQAMRAMAMARRRVMLVGEAAHVFPPIGAQGLNMSLRDAAIAAELIGDACRRGSDAGGEAVIAAYDAARRRDTRPRIGVIDTVNRSLLAGVSLIDEVRALGLNLVAAIPYLRRRVMRAGLAETAFLPRSMRDTKGTGV
jgi:2-octaprenyl-6-methoxyphenol hydroxylase